MTPFDETNSQEYATGINCLETRETRNMALLFLKSGTESFSERCVTCAVVVNSSNDLNDS